LFLFIGADPNTDWLPAPGSRLDDKGFIRTGGNLESPLETSLPGVLRDRRCFALVRSSEWPPAVGEGAQVVAALHAFLAKAGDKGKPATIGGP